MEALERELLGLKVREKVSCLKGWTLRGAELLLEVLWHLREVSKVFSCRLHFLKVTYKVESYHGHPRLMFIPSKPVKVGKCGRRWYQSGLHSLSVISDTTGWFLSLWTSMMLSRLWLSHMGSGYTVGMICMVFLWCYFITHICLWLYMYMLMWTDCTYEISLPWTSLRYGFDFGIYLVYLTWYPCRKKIIQDDKKNGRLQFPWFPLQISWVARRRVLSWYSRYIKELEGRDQKL